MARARAILMSRANTWIEIELVQGLQLVLWLG
jgi:hypothetical protein